MTKARRRKRGPGGRQPGAGRKGLFVGPRVKVGIKLTVQAVALIAKAKRRLQKTHGDLATDSAAVEWLIRSASAAPMPMASNLDARPSVRRAAPRRERLSADARDVLRQAKARSS